MDGAHERTTRQSCDESLRRLGLRCPLMRRHHNARGRFELAGQLTPIHSPALVDLLGRVPGAPPELPTGSQPTTSCRGPGATCHPWGHGGCLGWRSRCIRRDTAGGAGRRRELRSRARTGRRGGGEAEGCPRRGDRAGRHLGPTRRTLPCSVGCTAPHAGAWPPGRRRRALLKPTRRLRHRDYHRPSASGRAGP